MSSPQKQDSGQGPPYLTLGTFWGERSRETGLWARGWR